MANSVGAEKPRKKYVMRSKPPALNLSTRTAVVPECVFESPQKENLGGEPFSARRVTIAAKIIGGRRYGEKEKAETYD